MASHGSSGGKRRHRGHHRHRQVDHAANPGHRDAGGTSMMLRSRALVWTVIVILVAGLVFFGVAWALWWG